MPALQTKALPPALYRFAQNPSAIAAIASFGAHALLFALLPLLPSAILSTQEPEIKRSVGVVELTPAEKTRLPEISNSLIELPSIARQPLPSQSSTYSFNPLPAPPAPSDLPPYAGYSSESDPILDLLRQYSDAAQPVPVTSDPPAPPQQATAPKPAESQTPRTNSESTPQPTSTPTNNSSSNSTPTPANQPSPRSLDEIRQAQSDRIRQRREQLAQLATDDTGIDRGTVYANMGTWSDAAGAWLGGDQKKFDQINFKEPIQIAAIYPETACPLQPKHPVWVGVLVDADGKVVDEPDSRPQILQGSGYRIFNQKAIEDAIAHSFEPTGEKKAYILQVNYEYTPEACPNATPASPSQNSQG